jgi:hypothetical protein
MSKNLAMKEELSRNYLSRNQTPGGKLIDNSLNSDDEEDDDSVSNSSVQAHEILNDINSKTCEIISSKFTYYHFI